MKDDCCLNLNISASAEECCCNCEYQRWIKVCRCTSCSKIQGYICIAFHELASTYTCSYSVSEHGRCELWTIKRGVINKNE